MKLPAWLQRSTPPAEKREQIGAWPALPFGNLGFGLGTSYQEVDAVTGENSLQSVAFRTAADLMASLVSELHFDVYSGDGPTRKKRRMPGYLDDPSGDGYGREDWTYMLLMSWFLRGNGYGRILDQGPTGMLRQVDLYHPDRVGVHLEDGEPKWTAHGREIPTRAMFHRRVNPIAGNLLGLSPVAMHADTLGLSITTTRFGKQWFQDGGHPSGILSNSEVDMADSSIGRNAKEQFLAALFGSREPVVLGRGWKFDPIQVKPEESQFLQTQGYTEAQAARIMGAGLAEVLGYATGGSMTYANVVDRDLSLLKYAANRWLQRVERVYNSFLPRPQYAVADRDSFLDTNVMQRWLVNEKKLKLGAYTINEIRGQVSDPPVDWGNEPFTVPTGDTGGDPNPEVAPPGGNGGEGGED